MNDLVNIIIQIHTIFINILICYRAIRKHKYIRIIMEGVK